MVTRAMAARPPVPSCLIGDLYVSTALGCVGIEGLFLDPEGPRDSPPHTTSKEFRIRNMPAPKIILND
jgi:hypothetical protein